MKKFIFLMAIAILSSGFMSCGKDNDEDVDNYSTEEIEQGLVGRWICYEFSDDNNKLRQTTLTEKLLNNPEAIQYHEYIDFKSDGSAYIQSSTVIPMLGSSSTLCDWNCSKNMIIISRHGIEMFVLRINEFSGSNLFLSRADNENRYAKFQKANYDIPKNANYR